MCIRDSQGPFTLGTAGTYTLLIEGRFFDSGTGSYTFNVQPVSDQSLTLTVGATVSGAIDETGEVDRYGFTLTNESQLYFDSFTNSSNFRWTLAGPAGTH